MGRNYVTDDSIRDSLIEGANKVNDYMCNHPIFSTDDLHKIVKAMTSHSKGETANE